jgi:hypothetical protein
VPKVVDKTLEGRDERTPLWMHFGVLGVVGIVVIVVLAIAFPLYYAFGGK